MDWLALSWIPMGLLAGACINWDRIVDGDPWVSQVEAHPTDRQEQA